MDSAIRSNIAILSLGENPLSFNCLLILRSSCSLRLFANLLTLALYTCSCASAVSIASWYPAISPRISFNFFHPSMLVFFALSDMMSANSGNISHNLLTIPAIVFSSVSGPNWSYIFLSSSLVSIHFALVSPNWLFASLRAALERL